MSPTGFRRTGARTEYEGRRYSMRVVSVEAPSGESFEREFLVHPGAVVVIPLHDDDTITLVRQYRAAVDDELLELPAGIRDVDDEPLERTAARELTEETGLVAERFELVSRLHNSAGCTDEEDWIFLATGLSDGVGDFQGVEEQHMSTERLGLAEVRCLVADGLITDATTIIGVLLAVERRGAGG
ncbi:NUDIX hydrolase [soil metagenome]